MNVGIDANIYDVINAAIAFVNAGGLDDEFGGSPKGDVVDTDLQQVVAGGFDVTNFIY